MGIRKIISVLIMTAVLILTAGCGAQKLEEAKPSLILLSIDKTSIAANGLDVATITSEVRDQFGKVMEGQSVSYYAGAEKLETNQFKSTTPGAYKIKAVTGSISSAEVTLNVNEAVKSIEISADKTEVLADYNTYINFTVKKKDYNDKVTEITPDTLTRTHVSTQKTTSTDTLNSTKSIPNEFGEYDIIATYMGVSSKSLRVNFKEMPRANSVIVTGNKNTIKADNSEQVTLSTTVIDQYGNEMENSGVSYTFKTSAGTEISMGSNNIFSSNNVANIIGTYAIYATKGNVKSIVPFNVSVVDVTHVILQTDKPVLPAGGTYNTSAQIIIPVASGTTVMYTTDGTDPTMTYGTQITADTTITVTNTTVIKAVAYKSGMSLSGVASEMYVITKTADAPILPANNIFSNSANITIPVISGTTVKYTIDGSDPSDTNGIAITANTIITINKTITLKAFAQKNGYLNSNIALGVYVIVGTVAQPKISAGGVFTSATQSTISVEAGTKVRYTIDGTTPTATNGIEITSDTILNIATTTTVKAFAYKDGSISSDVTSVTYEITGKVAAPILPPNASYNSTAIITIPVIPGTKVRYTIDGTQATISTGVEITTTTTISLTTTAIVSAIAYKDGFDLSSVTWAAYTVVTKTVKPVLQATGQVLSGANVTIPVVSGTKVRYTIDNSDPSFTNGIEISTNTNIQIVATTILKAVAYKDAVSVSDIATSIYTIKPGLDTPVIQNTRQYTTDGSITLTIPCLAGTTVYYTLNGTTPSTSNGTAITANTNIQIAVSTTLKVIATASGFTDSNIATATYTIQTARPILPADISSTSAFSITIPVLAGTTLRYTTDLSNPSSTNGNLITSDTIVQITTTTTIKAAVFKTGCLDSDMTSGTYTISSVVIPVNMVRVEAGTFIMGSTSGDTDEAPTHSVTIGYNFFMAQYEVTQMEYTDQMTTNPCTTTSAIGDLYPVFNVTWKDAIKYCNKISIAEGVAVAYNETTGALLDANGAETTDISKVVGYRLPTEAEWEYAARGGKKSQNYTYSGGNTIDTIANYWDNHGVYNYGADITGQKVSNELGIYDMTGNVAEWCSDYYATYTSNSVTNPYVTSGSGRAIRGGSWLDAANYNRIMYRNYGVDDTTGDFKDISLGFRLVRKE